MHCSLVGNTPLFHVESLDIENVDIYAKLEFLNPFGSVKDRVASFVLEHLLEQKEITKSTLIVESSSGNYAIALAAACRSLGLRFHCVIDPHISETNRKILQATASEVTEVSVPDSSGSFLLKRLSTVQEIVHATRDSYWMNQYGNPLNARAYEQTIGREICRDMDPIDFAFIGVGSGGTITGISRAVKDHFPSAQVIAVDTVGSVIFGGPPGKRYIPGIGSSIVPPILESARIDDVVYVHERTAIAECRQLLASTGLMTGGSSGSVLAAIRHYFLQSPAHGKVQVATIFADRGDRYDRTIYDDTWCQEKYGDRWAVENAISR